MAGETYAPVLLLSTEELHSFDHPSLQVHLQLVKLTNDAHLRNYSSSGYSGELGYADLGVHAYFDRTTNAHGFWAWRTEFTSVMTVDVERAKAMAKTLTTVDRKLERLRAKWGYPETFHAYITRVADALGVETYAWLHKANVNGAWGYDGNEYHFGDATLLSYQLNGIARKFDELHGTKPVMAT